MRALILGLGATLALAACGGDETQQVVINDAETEGAASIATNDTTAIDAATADAANMADDVDFTIENADNNADEAVGNAADNASGSARR
jgi:ABC-type glycerol-3-phosphate transport system substrate-binding protein